MKIKKISKLKRLYYNEQKSAREVAREMGVSITTVYRTMRSYGLERRDQAGANHAYFTGKESSYQIKAVLTREERELMISALMLYWAEGAKTGSTVDLVNSDPIIVQLFLAFLRRVCQIDERRLRVQVYAFANQDIYAILNFWSVLLHIPKDQFIRPYIQTKFDETKIHKMTNGLVHLRYHDKKLLVELQRLWEEVGTSLLHLGRYRSGQTGQTVKRQLFGEIQR